MNKVWSSAVVVAGLVFTLGGVSSWAQVPSTNDTSDSGRNTGGGTNALKGNFGVDNTAYGAFALSSGTGNGSINTAVGTFALQHNTDGDFNTALGADALISNTTGSNNTASGTSALQNNTTGDNNTATGDSALFSNTTGTYNTATGHQALYGNNGSYNTALGGSALSNNNTGVANTAVGTSALQVNASGYGNTASGFKALNANTSGSNNTASGYKALFSNTTGVFNTALGFQALYNNTVGTRNLALGFNAGFYLINGNYNIYLGNKGGVGDSNTMRLGSALSQTRTFIAGIYGVPISGAQVTINNQGQLGILPSSARYKRDIAAMGERSQGLYSLRPVTFLYKQDPQRQQQYGLIAEEVAKVYPELVTKGADGKVESVQYHELIPMLLNEVQHQQQEIVELKAQAQQVAELKVQNESLRAALVQRDEEQRGQNAALASRLERLEAGAVHAATLATR